MPERVNWPLEFTLGHRTVIATQAQRLDPNVTFGHIWIRAVRLALERILHSCPWLKVLRPDWLLPSTIILKKHKPDGHAEFEIERHAYHILKPLQGTVISYLYGEASYDGAPALILSEIQGQTLYQIVRPKVEDPALENRLESAFKRLNEFGVIHGDAELHNIFDDGQRVMLVDFEFAEFEQNEPWEESSSKGDVGNVMDEYRRRRPALWNRKVRQ